MSTSLATQRSFVIANPSANVVESNLSNGSANTQHLLSTKEIKHEIITITTEDDLTDDNGLQLEDVLSQKKIIIHQHQPQQQQQQQLQQTDNDVISDVLDVVPMDASDSSNGESDSMHDLSAIKNGVELAQVTVLHPDHLEDGGSPQYITVTVSTQDTVGGQNSYQVQYVDTELYHSNSSQSQMTYPFCPVGDYQTTSQSYYSTTANYTTTNTPPSHTSGLPYLVPGEENLLLNTSSQSRESPPSLSEVSYLQEAQTPTSTTPSIAASSGTGSVTVVGVNNAGVSGAGGVIVNGGLNVVGDSNNLANANKIASATIKWLTRNYETAEGVSLPRSTLYNHYMHHCNENKSEPVNAASFGKLIRSVFSGLRTRRLGTRGNSKYHYYGIRIKPGSTLSHAMEDKPGHSFSGKQSNGSSGSGGGSGGNLNGIGCGGSGSGGAGNGNNLGGSGGGSSGKGMKKHNVKPEAYEACSQYLGDGSGCIPIFPHIELDNTFNNELTLDDVETFRSIYREHCESFLDAVLNLEFGTIEYLWRDFWRSSDNNNLDECEEEKYLSKTKLYLLCHCHGVQKFIKEVDYQFYQNMVDVLIPDVLRSIPNSLTQAIRNFAKNLEIWLCESMVGAPERVVQIKSAAISAFCQTLRRYTSLNHLAQAARAVLQNNSQIAQMLNDLNRVDFHNVQEQAAWVCQCDTSIVQRLENDFKTALQQQNTLEQWASWLRLVVDSALEEYRDKPNYAKAARQFLLKWSFYSSMVIRDLTLRSASSFGSFHLIRLLYDEYMFFLVEHKVAEVLQKTAIAVISDRMQKETDFEFDYQLAFIDTESSPAKRMKHE